MITEHKDTDLFWITDDFYNLFDTMMEKIGSSGIPSDDTLLHDVSMSTSLPM